MPILTDARVAAALADVAPPAEARLVSGLAARAWYPDPGARPVSDIDVVLLDEAALAQLRQRLLEAGWRAVYATRRRPGRGSPPAPASSRRTPPSTRMWMPRSARRRAAATGTRR